MRLHPTATASVVLIATFFAGLLAGVLVERALFAGTPDAHASAPVPAARDARPWDREALEAELQLTPDQVDHVDRILEHQQQQVRAILSETRPRTRAILRETRRQIHEVLTPDQRDRWDQLHREHRRGHPDRGAE